MPKSDGTGPNGKGPMTGRGSGSCIIPLNTNEQEVEYLKNQQQALRRELNRIKNRIKRIENKENQEESTR
jgi:hypothetical protein